MKRSFSDERFIKIRNQYEQGNEEHKRYEELTVNDITTGSIQIDGDLISFKRRTIDDKITILLPNDFHVMDALYIKMKYAAYQKEEKLIYTNKDTTINLIFDFQETKMPVEETEDVRDMLSMVVLKKNPSSTMIKKGSIQAEDFIIAHFDLVTAALDSDIYNLMFLFSYEGYLTMGTFNCLQTEMHNWSEIGMQMIKSIEKSKS